MSIDFKDFLYLLAYIVSIVGVFLSFKIKLANLERELHQYQRIIFGEKGTLNLVDAETCKEHRDHIFTAIRRSESVMELALKKIEDLNENVLEIMIHMQIRRKKEKEKD